MTKSPSQLVGDYTNKSTTKTGIIVRFQAFAVGAKLGGLEDVDVTDQPFIDSTCGSSR